MSTLEHPMARSNGALPLAQNLLSLYSCIRDNGPSYISYCKLDEVGGVGLSELHAQGTVYNLRRVSDLDGLYVAADANVAIGSGPGAQTMRNEHGMIIHLGSEQPGVKLTLGGQGVRITLKDR